MYTLIQSMIKSYNLATSAPIKMGVFVEQSKKSQLCKKRDIPIDSKDANPWTIKEDKNKYDLSNDIKKIEKSL